MNDANDKKLIDLFWSRDENAIHETQQLYGAYLRTDLANILPNGHDAEECLNDTLFALWNSIPPERPRCFKAYLTTLARTTAIDRIRTDTRKKRKASEYEVCLDELCNCLTCETNTEEEVENALLREEIEKFIRGLDKQKRHMFVARYCLSTSPEQIARDLCISRSTVFRDLSILKAELKEKLEKEGFLCAKEK